MKAVITKRLQRERRKLRVRGGVFGTPERPRMSVFRSLKNISVQIIDDLGGKTLCSMSSQSKELAGGLKRGGNRTGAETIGRAIAERARMQGIRQVVFDRNGYRYHGRVKALADAARKAGLEF